MAGQTLGPLPKYWTIGKAEKDNLNKAMKKPLSGYIGGYPSEGYWVNKLARDWEEEFLVNHAVPCNSATSGLMAACMAAGIGYGDEVWVSTYTMSATATCAMILGAKVRLLDIDPTFFCMVPPTKFDRLPKAIIVTNLFGCAAALPLLRDFCDQFDIILIEDNAQAPYATVGGRLAGTVGHIGVFSLNVHKHIQCGEGGVIVTDDRELAHRLEYAINHGELAKTTLHAIETMGGNFRMTEPIAAIACAQLKKGFGLVQSRIDLAEQISDIFREVSFVDIPEKRFGEIHSYYLWAGKINEEYPVYTREHFVSELASRGVPFRVGYSPLLHELFEDDASLPVAEEIEHKRLITFEICAYDLKTHHLNRMRDIILEEAGIIEKDIENAKGPEGERSDRDAGGVSGSH